MEKEKTFIIFTTCDLSARMPNRFSVDGFGGTFLDVKFTRSTIITHPGVRVANIEGTIFGRDNQAALVMGLITGIGAVIWGVLLRRFVFRT